MARLDDLITQVIDKALRQRLEAAVADMRRRQRFGLVFEEHVPETTALVDFPIQTGATVQRRSDPEGNQLYVVSAMNGRGRVTIDPEGERGLSEQAAAKDLMVVRRFGDPIFPALRSVDCVGRAAEGRPHHAVINGENFHALQLLLYLYEKRVDCIYIDPPYNTGARNWKYNNCYVDNKDSWRHSKWLSFMEKRLLLAKRLLKPDGVLIVTIDENEVHHLGMLLEKLLPDARRQMVSVCINPSGASGDGLSRVEEYVFFCFLGSAQPVATTDDMLTPTSESGEQPVGWESLLRRGNSWYRKARPNLCYPVKVDPRTQRIVGVGPRYRGGEKERRPKTLDGCSVAWPVRKDGKLGIWRVDAKKLMALVTRGYAYASSWDQARGTWSIKYLLSGTVRAIEDGRVKIEGRGKQGEVVLSATPRRTTAKTIWYRGRHTAGGGGGTQAVAALLGARNLFDYPKSLYSVRDSLQVAVGDRKDALILDFFAGSGTTLHATCLLNSYDDGVRRCILVTNNEVEDAIAQDLSRRGVYRGDPEFERHGIFERVTLPRCKAAITGCRPDGKPVEGAYLDGRPYSEGFAENAEFFRLEYLDADDVDLGHQFAAILPCLWLAAGGVGPRSAILERDGFAIPTPSHYAILFRDDKFRHFNKALRQRPDVTHVWIVTDSEDAFAEMRTSIPSHIHASMLYRDYLRNFRINTRHNL